MDVIRDSLKEIGFKNNDISTYLALLKKGKSSVIEISTESKVHRVAVYSSLKKLMKQGLVSYIILNNKRYFVLSYHFYPN